VIFEDEANHKMVTIDLRDGAAKTLDVELTALVTVTGHLVVYGSQKPVAGFHMVARPAHGAGTPDPIMLGETTENVTDEAGRFTLRRVPVGEVLLRGVPSDFFSSDHASLQLTRTITGTGTVDIGDVSLIRPRVQPGELVGVPGLSFARGGDPQGYRISAIDPGGPAAGTALQVGDVITTCDGFDVTGGNSMNFGTLMTAPPGTTLTFGTRRGVTVTIVLARAGVR
jgi:hypothetical protein